MAVDLAKLVVRLEAQSSKLTTDLERANRKIDSFGSKAKKSLGAFKAAVVGAFAVGAAFQAKSLVSNFTDTADGLAKLSEKVGITVEDLSTLDHAATLSGASMETLEKGVGKLSTSLLDAARGSKEYVDSFGALGIETKRADGTLRTTKDVLFDLADVFESMPDSTEKTSLAMKLLGRSGRELIPLLNSGSDGIRNMQDEARLLGLEISTNTAQAAEQFNDNLTRLKGNVRGLAFDLGEQLVPALQETTEWWVQFLVKSKSGFEKQSEELSDLQSKLGDLTRNLRSVSQGGLLQKWLYGDEDSINQKIEETRIRMRALTNEILEANIKFVPKPGDVDFTGPIFKKAPPKITFETPESIARRKNAQTQAEREFEEAVKNSEAAVKAENAAYVEWQSTLDDAAQALREQINPLEKMEAELASLDELLAQGKIDWELYGEAVFNSMERTDAALDKLKEDTKEVGDGARDMGFAFQSAFEEAVLGGQKFSDILRGLGRDVAQVLLRQTVTNPLQNVVTGGLSGLFPGFAHGGSFTVGGAGGTDSQLVAFRATPGEKVSIRTPAQQAGGGTSISISVDARGAEAGVETKIRAAMNLAIQEAKQQVFASIERGGAFARAVGRTA